MRKVLFANPQDAEAAFYEAFTKGDLDAMMVVWADDEEIFCVHPGGPRATGIAQVRESWRQVFASGQALRFQLRGQQYLNGMMLSAHSVYEHVTVAGESRARTPVIATNIFQRTERGWRMVAHHASPAPAPAPATVEPEGRQQVRTILH